MAESLEAVRRHIHGVEQLDAVIGAMRGIAAAHAQQSRALLPGFRAYADVIAGAIAEALRLRNTPANGGAHVRTGQIIFCAEHGFAGNFSEHVVAASAPADAVLAIGSRGSALLAARGIRPVWQAPMATRVGGIAPLCTRIADGLYAVIAEHELTAVAATFAVWHPGQGLAVQTSSLLPLDTAVFGRSFSGAPPLATLPPEILLESLAAEYVYAELCQMAMQAFVAENEARAAAMVRARSNVREMLSGMQATERQVRQEAITAELVELAGAIRPPSQSYCTT